MFLIDVQGLMNLVGAYSSVYYGDKIRLTDDKSETEWVFSKRTPSNYFCHLKVSTILYRFSQLIEVVGSSSISKKSFRI